jgi:hypothetical protein
MFSIAENGTLLVGPNGVFSIAENGALLVGANGVFPIVENGALLRWYEQYIAHYDEGCAVLEDELIVVHGERS